MSDGVYYVDTDQLNRLCAEQQVQIKYLKEDKARLMREVVDLAQENGRLAATLREQVVKTENALVRATRAEQMFDRAT